MKAQKVRQMIVGDFRRRLVDGEMAQAGIGMFQMLLAIAIFMVFVGAAAMMFADADTKRKIQLAKQNRDIVRTNVQTIFAQVPDYSGVANTIKGVFPDIMKKSGGVKNVWNGAVTVAPETDVTRFSITYAGVPEDECVQLATDQGWISVTVGTTDIPAGSTAVATASTACGATNTIKWVSN